MAITGQFAYALNNPFLYTDASGFRAECECCNDAIGDWATRGKGRRRGRGAVTFQVYTPANRVCDVEVRCTSEGCPQQFPAYTSSRNEETIDICLDCRMASSNFEQTMYHEVQHAIDFCGIVRWNDDRETCKEIETSAYKQSCMYLFPKDKTARDRCITCGVFFSCWRHNLPNANPPCMSSVLTIPCWKYEPGKGFVPDKNDPRCRKFRRNRKGAQ